MSRINRSDFVESIFILLCSYVGDDRVFESIVKCWGIESLYNVVSKAYEEYLKEKDKDSKMGDVKFLEDEIEAEEKKRLPKEKYYEKRYTEKDFEDLREEIKKELLDSNFLMDEEE